MVGRVWSIDAYPNGVDVNRWSITLMDKTGSAASVAFKQFVGLCSRHFERGRDRNTERRGGRMGRTSTGEDRSRCQGSNSRALGRYAVSNPTGSDSA